MPVINFGAEKAPQTLADRLDQLRNVNLPNQAQPSAGLGAPQTFILRNLKHNPFIHRIDTELTEEEIRTHTTILTNGSTEAQDFLGQTSLQAEEVSKKIVKFASDMFALEVGTGMAEDFIEENLPPEIDYSQVIENIIPRLEKALVKRLAKDIGIDLFECPEISDLSDKPKDVITRLMEIAKAGN